MRTRRNGTFFAISRPTTRATKASTHREWQARASGFLTTIDLADGETAALLVFSGYLQVLVVVNQCYRGL
jgi:hypothetical protein